MLLLARKFKEKKAFFKKEIKTGIVKAKPFKKSGLEIKSSVINKLPNWSDKMKEYGVL
jgi:hypothetical protein